MSAAPREIPLSALGVIRPGVIVEHPGGFLYTNQTHHLDCRTSEAVGYYLPLGASFSACWEHCEGEGRQRFLEGLPLMPPEEVRRRIEAEVERSARDVLHGFRIVPDRGNAEAWLRCSFHSPVLSGGGDEPLLGWLTWGNCD